MAARKKAVSKAPAEKAEKDPKPSEDTRQGMRGHNDAGNIRPADGRWGLHDPEDESQVTATGVKQVEKEEL